MTRAVTKAEELVAQYGTRDPFSLAKELGVKVYMRTDFAELKGFYRLVLDQPCIFLNANLDEGLLRTVCAHELGHELLHRELSGIAAYSAFNLSTKPEYEASLFAATLLIDEHELFELSRQELSIDAIAAQLSCQKELVILRMHELNKAAEEEGSEQIFSLNQRALGSFLNKNQR